MLTHSWTMVRIYTPWKTIENQTFFGVFRELYNVNIGLFSQSLLMTKLQQIWLFFVALSICFLFLEMTHRKWKYTSGTIPILQKKMFINVLHDGVSKNFAKFIQIISLTMVSFLTLSNTSFMTSIFWLFYVLSCNKIVIVGSL